MRTRISALVAMACLLSGFTSVGRAQELVQIDWGGTTGNRDWHTASNWVGGVVPNTSLDIANLGVNLGSNLTVSLGGVDATVARLILGSKSGATTTDVASTGGRLIFLNEEESEIVDGNDADFDNNGRVNGRDFLIWQRGYGTTSPGDNINGAGDANNDLVVNGADLAIWQEQYGLGVGFFHTGIASIESTGVAGTTNVITAPIHLPNERLEIGGVRDLAINGPITFEGDAANSNISNAGIAVLSRGMTVTLNSNFNLVNSDAGDANDFYLNNHVDSQGTLVVNGIISGEGDLFIGVNSNGTTALPITRLNTANTHSGGTLVSRGYIEVNNNQAFGTGTYRVDGPANQYGYNLVSDDDTRTIPNNITLAAWQSVKGEHSLTFSGAIQQTNNRGFINLLPEGKTVNFTGRVNIWEEQDPDNPPEEVDRRFVVDGTGLTILSGTIHNDPVDAEPPIANIRQISKTGTGTLLLNVANAGDNFHRGNERVTMGYLRYANNNSLNAHPEGRIIALGGAVGVDTHPGGQTLATNTAFLNQLDPTNVGGLMLSPNDAATNLDFNSGALVNAANMTVAAPEGGITYTGTITPAGSTYKLGGGTGTLTLPNAQLTGGNSLVVRNGGVVRLLGDNTYTGSTSVTTRYVTSRQEQAAVDEASDAPGIFFNRLVASVLEVDDLANGGQPSSIGSSSNAASNLKLHGTTLRYTGTGDTTDRLFTVGTGGGTLDSSGSGAIVFSNTGALAIPDATDKIGTLNDFGSAAPNEIIDVNDTSDIIIGMTVSDPDTGGPIAILCDGGSTRNCIPAGTTVTGISDDGRTIGMSANTGVVWKQNTRLVFGAVARTLTLTGSNAQANILSATIANSDKGGVVNIVKQGTGTWLLEGVSTSTGTTTVEAGTLGGNGGVGGNLVVNTDATFAPGGTGASAIGDFSVGGNFTMNAGSILNLQLGGTSPGSYDVLNVTGSALLNGTINLSTLAFSPAVTNQFTVLTAAGGITDAGLTITGLTGFTKAIVGNSLVLTKSAALSALVSVPEPTALVLLGLGMACLGLRRK